MNKNYKNLTLWVVVCCFVAIIIQALQYNGNQSQEIAFSRFITEMTAGNVKSVVMKGPYIEGRLNDSTKFNTYAPHDSELATKLTNRNIEVIAAPQEENISFFHILIGWLPLIILIAIWFFMMRQVQGGGGKAFSFGKSKAKLLENIINYQNSIN